MTLMPSTGQMKFHPNQALLSSIQNPHRGLWSLWLFGMSTHRERDWSPTLVPYFHTIFHWKESQHASTFNSKQRVWAEGPYPRRRLVLEKHLFKSNTNITLVLPRELVIFAVTTALKQLQNVIRENWKNTSPCQILWVKQTISKLQIE